MSALPALIASIGGSVSAGHPVPPGTRVQRALLEWPAVKPAIIFGEGDVACAVAASLAGQGVTVDLLYTRSRDHARFSRFFRNRTRLSADLQADESAVRFLETDPRLPAGALLLPVTDACVSLVSRYRDRLAGRFIPAVAAWEALGKLLDKHELYRQAAAVDVPTPRFQLVDNGFDLDRIAREWRFPLLLKPAQTHLFFRIFKRKLLVVGSLHQLREAVESSLAHGLKVMACELVPGPDTLLYQDAVYCGSSGGITFGPCTRKIRQFPRGFGVACCLQTRPVMDELRDYTERILRAVAYRGIAIAEFKQDPGDGRYKLMEVNVRPVLFDGLLTTAGFNQPWICYRDLMLGEAPTSGGFNESLLWQHNFLELVRLMYLRDLPWRGYLEARLARDVAAVPLRRDPGAWLAKLGVYLIEAISGARPLGDG